MTADPPRLQLQPLVEADYPALVEWLSSDRWPYHGSPQPTPTEVRKRIADADFANPDTQTFWLVLSASDSDSASPRVGLVSLQDLGDLTPIFDLRLRSEFRGQGLGGDALDAIARQVFGPLDKTRVEGHTRVDNVGMRRTFLKRGWVKEAHYRQAWPGEGGVLHDAVTYGLLRSDVQRGTQTPVPWEHEPASER